MPVFDDLLGFLMKPQPGRNRRISSNEQPNWNDGNFDMTRLAPRQVFELPVLNGPGVIHHIWMTSHAGGVGELNAITLRIYWDGREEPGVEAPLAEFFAVGQGRPAVVESLPVQVSPTGSLSCYWRMPFAKSARIVISNDNPDRASGLYWQVDWVELPELPPDTPYFHARYRQEYPAVMGRDYLIAEIEGKGHYVGTMMSVTMAQDGWFGEGDDFFYIDGEEVPSLQGTGSEDYFNDAWGFRERTSIWFGQPRWQGWSGGDSGICYRWHVLDPVRFERSLKVTMEHKGNRDIPEEAWYIERPDYFNSVAFWYQTGAPKPFGELPPWPERNVPWRKHLLVRAFRRAEVTGGAELAVQTTGFFGGRPALFWPNDSPEGRLSLPFTVEEAGRHAVRLVAFTFPDYGAFDIELDGEVVKRAVEFRASDGDETDLLLGTFDLEAGEHTLGFAASTAGGRAPGYLGVEMLKLLKLPPEAKRAVKNENEAHFVRMGIGRAVYAYRLAYGDLPDSLQTLVDSGMMEPMYLKDENGYPLTSRREDDRFHAESAAPNGWKHSWQGLDARR
ncbi:MAG: DUF2961 domain-containing protein [Armatimonadetes bacterium]|nr:DUF2961 domain-containing protein [Armatimonadota bacterium]